VVANATAESVKTLAGHGASCGTKLTAVVRWVECMQQAARLGGESCALRGNRPGAVLAGLLKRIVPEANVVSLGTADEVTKFMESSVTV